MDITTEFLNEFKDHMKITHSAEDEHLKRLLSASVAAITAMCGDFDVNMNERARELVIERSRYAYNDALEYFDTNFLSQINSLGLSLALPDYVEVDPDASV